MHLSLASTDLDAKDVTFLLLQSLFYKNVQNISCFCHMTDAAGVTFDGHSRVTYDVSGEGQYVQTYEDRLKLRFRTTQADGLVFYADGNQGDYVVLELVNGKLYFHIDLGKFVS